MPMHFIAMDSRDNVKPIPQGYQYALTVIDMLTNYAWCRAELDHRNLLHM